MTVTSGKIKLQSKHILHTKKRTISVTFPCTLFQQGFASKYYRLHNSKLAEWSPASGRRHTGCCENYPISSHHFSTLFVISLPSGGFCKVSELVCKDCWPNLSEMELRTFLRIQKLVLVQVLTCNAEIIQK